MLRSLEEKVQPGHTALLLVDVQNDFCAKDGALSKTGADTAPARAVASTAVRLLKTARASGVLPIFLRLAAEEATESDAWIEQRLRRAGEPYRRWCGVGCWGWEFYEVAPLPSEPVLDKYRYSAFEGTKLGFVLRAAGIKTVVVGGVATNVCVDTAVREASARDYYVVLPADLTAGTSSEAHDAALANLGTFFCEVTTTAKLSRIWTRSDDRLEEAARIPAAAS